MKLQKICRHCGQLELHYACRDGRCIKCYAAARTRYDGMKRCPACKSVKPLETFAESETSRDGRRYRCRECDKQRDSSVLFCEQCCGLPWRRPSKLRPGAEDAGDRVPDGVCRCGLEYQAEQMPTATEVLRQGSSASTWALVGDSELTNYHRDENGEFRNRGVRAAPEYRRPMPMMRCKQAGKATRGERHG